MSTHVIDTCKHWLDLNAEQAIDLTLMLEQLPNHKPERTRAGPILRRWWVVWLTRGQRPLGATEPRNFLKMWLMFVLTRPKIHKIWPPSSSLVNQKIILKHKTSWIFSIIWQYPALLFWVFRLRKYPASVSGKLCKVMLWQSCKAGKIIEQRGAQKGEKEPPKFTNWVLNHYHRAQKLRKEQNHYCTGRETELHTHCNPEKNEWVLQVL